MSTQSKEQTGKELVERCNILNLFFKGIKDIEWVTDRDRQVSGIDWILTMEDGSQINIDLKVGIGDYTTCPIEISQKTLATNGEYTLTNSYDKKTDYFLYTLKTGNIVDFVLLPYRPIARECNLLFHGANLECEIFPKRPIVHLSWNGSGYFVKFKYAEAIAEHKLPGAKMLCGVNI